MSRSLRHTPKCGCTTAPSEKYDKRITNRRFRLKARLAIHHDRDPPTLLRQISDIWNFRKDGKQYFGCNPNEQGEQRNQTGDEWWYRAMRK